MKYSFSNSDNILTNFDYYFKEKRRYNLKEETKKKPHIPDSCGRVTSTADQDVDGGVEGETVDCRQMTVVMSNNLENEQRYS